MIAETLPDLMPLPGNPKIWGIVGLVLIILVVIVIIAKVLHNSGPENSQDDDDYPNSSRRG